MKEKIENLIKKEIENFGYRLIKVEIKEKGRVKELWITIDKENGVSVEDCANVSRKIEPILENFSEQKWYLIVSSKGIEISEEELKKLK
jgi:ribosome maturation factor RimP